MRSPDVMYADCLHLLEETTGLFGPVLNDWKFKGVEITDGSPELRYSELTGTVVATLPESVFTNTFDYLYELSFQVCRYVISQRSFSEKDTQPLVISQGVCAWFAMLMISRLFKDFTEVADCFGLDANYYAASQIVNEMMEMDVGSIKKLREIKPRLDELEFDDFAACDIRLPFEKIDALLKRFE